MQFTHDTHSHRFSFRLLIPASDIILMLILMLLHHLIIPLPPQGAWLPVALRLGHTPAVVITAFPRPFDLLHSSFHK